MRKEIIMMITDNKKPGWSFYPGWVVLHIATVIMAWYIAWAIISLIENFVGGRIQVNGQPRITADFLFLYVLFPVIGLLTGFLQYTLLRRYLPRMAGWIPATFLGWCLPFVLGFIITRVLTPGNSTLWIMGGLLVIGASIALPQWWMLRQRIQHASWWILAYGVGWCMIGLLNLVTSEPFAVLLAIGLMPTIASGIACWLLLDWYPQHELKASVPSY
jgi:hypothetical protein